MKRGQTNQAFQFFLAAIVLVTIVILGYNIIIKINDNFIKTGSAKFESDLQSYVDKLHLKSGSTAKEKIKVPSNVDKIYIVDTTQDFPDQTFRSFGELQDAVDYKAKNNVYMYKSNKLIHTFELKRLTLDDMFIPPYLCYKIIGGNLNIKFESKGNRIKLGHTNELFDCGMYDQLKNITMMMYPNANADKKIMEIIEASHKIKEHLEIKKELSYNGQNSTYKVQFKAIDELPDMQYIGMISKCFANDASEITFESPIPIEILDYDPVIMWDLSEMEPEDTINISISVDKEVEEWCSKFIDIIIGDFTEAEVISEYTCMDTDGGKNENRKGLVRGKEDGNLFEEHDLCISGNTKVREYFCTSTQLGYEYRAEDIDCPYGCEDGECRICQTRHSERCYNNELYWYDSCDNKGELIESCEDYCEDGECKVAPELSCIGGYCLEFIKPVGTETYYSGNKLDIRWSQIGIDKVTIGYKTCPSCLDWIIYNLPSTGDEVKSHSWQIPNTLTGTDVKISIIGYKTGTGSTEIISDSFTISNCGNDNQCDSGLICISNTCKPPLETECTDNDGHLSLLEQYYEKSEIIFKNQYGIEDTLEDTCITATRLKEQICSDKNPEIKEYDCENGCEDGECKDAPEEDIETEFQEIEEFIEDIIDEINDFDEEFKDIDDLEITELIDDTDFEEETCPLGEFEDCTLKINFQPQGITPPAGFIADIGGIFGERDGLKYGWDENNINAAQKRIEGSDLKKQTLTHFNNKDQFTNHPVEWKIEIPNGKYELTIAIGDLRYCDSHHQLVINNYPSNKIEFDTKDERKFFGIFTDECKDSFSIDSRIKIEQKIITITGNKIELKSIGGNNGNTKINYLIIKYLNS